MVFERIKEMIEEIIREKTEISPETRLMSDLGLDSLDIIELICDLEDEYDIEIDEVEREKIKTVAELVNTVEAKM